MKKQNFIMLLCGIAISSLFAFKIVKYEARVNTAEVEQMQGLSIFVDAKPVREYDYLGSEKIVFNLLGSGKYDDVRDKLIKKVKKEYPKANAIIFHLGDGKDKADAILIK